MDGKGELILRLMESQLQALRMRMAQDDLDPADLAESAETLLTYARCLRDFPDLPEVLKTKYPAPPESFRTVLEERPN